MFCQQLSPEHVHSKYKWKFFLAPSKLIYLVHLGQRTWTWKKKHTKKIHQIHFKKDIWLNVFLWTKQKLTFYLIWKAALVDLTDSWLLVYLYNYAYPLLGRPPPLSAPFGPEIFMDPESVVMETTTTQAHSPNPNIINMLPDLFSILKTERREAWTRAGPHD